MIQDAHNFARGDALHYRHLCDLVRNLERIGERKEDAESIIIEPDWYKEDSRGLYSLCDAFILYVPAVAIPIEYKRTNSKRQKAREQLFMGKKYAEDVLFRAVPYGKIVYYHGGRLDVERINFRNNSRD